MRAVANSVPGVARSRCRPTTTPLDWPPDPSAPPDGAFLVPTASPLPVSPVSLALTLPLPPGVNNQFLTVGKRRVLSPTARAFHRDVTKTISQARRSGAFAPPVEAALAANLLGVYLTFFFASPYRRDLDGGLKIALDALGRALGFDDRVVVDLHLTKKIDPLRPRLEVEIETIADWEFDRAYVYLGEPANESNIAVPPPVPGSIPDPSRAGR